MQAVNGEYLGGVENEVVQAEVTVHYALVDTSGTSVLWGDVGMEPGGEG